MFYICSLIVNVELLEIVMGGLFGTHRVLSRLLGLTYYRIFTGILEVFGFLVIIAVIVFFFIWRNFRHINCFEKSEIKTWTKTEINGILIFEFLLMVVFLIMNAANGLLHMRGVEDYEEIPGSFLVSDFFLQPYSQNFSEHALYLIEHTFCWLHFIGVLLVLNYLYYSKHLHILLDFPNTYFANLAPNGKLSLLESIRGEVTLMMNPQATVLPQTQENTLPRLGSADVWDLDQVQLLEAYACTECGRYRDQCQANMTGKKIISS
ncbi:MAG: hypothetical protein ACMUEM_04995 [Flavobacteriales bacterium AspAUS03]